MNHRDYIILQKIVKEIKIAEEFTNEMPAVQFLQDEKSKRAVCMTVINIGELALTCDLGKPDPLHNFGVALGTEHAVDVLSDTLSNHMIVSSKSVVVVLLHNHPSTQTFSLEDVQFFVQPSYAYGDSGGIESGNSPLSETG